MKTRRIDHLESYANKYDEIVKGYEDGTREIWVEDNNSETGYRKLIKEEDLAALDQAYETTAQIKEGLAFNKQHFKEALNEHLQQIANIRGEKYDYIDDQDEEPIERIYERMMNCRDTFKNRYSMVSTQGVENQNISSLINEIFSNEFIR